MQKTAPSSLYKQQVATAAKTILENNSLLSASLVFFAAFFTLYSVPFYNIAIAALLALICGAISYYKPAGGIIASFLLALPAFSYQSAGFAWVFAFLAIGAALFEIKGNWKLFAFLQIAIFSSFAQIPLFGLFAILALVLGSMNLGARKSLFLSLISVFAILLIGASWLVPNFAGLASLPAANYLPSEPAVFGRALPEPEFSALPSEFIFSISKMLSFGGILELTPALYKLAQNSISLLVQGTLIAQLAIWAGACFAISYLPAKFEFKFKQGAASLVLLLAAGANLALYTIYSIDMDMGYACAIFSACAIALCFVLDLAGIEISSEPEIEMESKMSKFGKFGEQKAGATNIRLSDIGGYDDVKRELSEAIAAPLQNKAVSSAYGLKPASGVLLFGPPGTGKTLIMKALASDLKLKFVDISCTDILSSWHGESEANVKDIFRIARQNAPCILFFDEIDALAKSRDKFFNDDVGPRVLSVLLQEMDGFSKKSSKPVIIVGATNVPHQLDAAIMRPGRLDKIIYMHLPDLAAREQILSVHCAKIPLGEDIDLHALASLSKGYSGADLANVAREAASLAAREARAKNKIVPVSQKHFLSVLGRLKPSTTHEQLALYEQFGREFERSMRGA